MGPRNRIIARREDHLLSVINMADIKANHSELIESATCDKSVERKQSSTVLSKDGGGVGS